MPSHYQSTAWTGYGDEETSSKTPNFDLISLLYLSGPGHAAKAILGAPCTYKYGQDMVSVYRLPRNAICAPCHKGAKAINEGVRTNSSLVNLFLTVSD